MITILVLILTSQPAMDHLFSAKAQSVGIQTESTTWRQLFPEILPGPRDLSAFTYDSNRNVFVLFSGRKENYTYNDDTWEWDGTNWFERIVTISPPAHGGHAMAYDSYRKKVILFGGSGTLDQQTWEWDGSVWTGRTPLKWPSARLFHVMGFDPVRNQVVLFGGSNSSGSLNDMWVYEFLQTEMLSANYVLKPKQIIDIPIIIDGSKVPARLKVSGLPQGVTGKYFLDSGIIPPYQASLQLTAAPNVISGEYAITVVAETDVQSTSLEVNLTIERKGKR